MSNVRIFVILAAIAVQAGLLAGLPADTATPKSEPPSHGRGPAPHGHVDSGRTESQVSFARND